MADWEYREEAMSLQGGLFEYLVLPAHPRYHWTLDLEPYSESKFASTVLVLVIFSVSITELAVGA